MMEYIQSDALSEYVLPLMRASYTEASRTKIDIDELYGTAFLIGNKGIAITAAHVIDQLQDGYDADKNVIVTHFLSKSGVLPFKIIDFEKHPTEDVGIVKIDGIFKSFLTISDKTENSSLEYHGWGYPREIAKEMSRFDDDAKDQPDLIFTKGHIRRNINRELYPTFIFRGSSFYEVSELGGSGYSGSPLININSIGQNKWDVVGVYVGEKEGEGVPVGYAVKTSCFADWIPKMLGHSIRKESLQD